jgi:hypothetical protein
MKCGGNSEPKASAPNVQAVGRFQTDHFWLRAMLTLRVVVTIIGVGAGLALSSHAQSSLPFDVSNPKHLKWSTEEADRIYASACELVARSIRPEKPPRLVPKFTLVLGAKEDSTLRNGETSEVHLRAWNAGRFAEAMVLVAMREVLKSEDVTNLTRDTLIAAHASVSVNELKRKE